MYHTIRGRFIISLVLTVVVINKRQHVYINLMETNTIYYSSKKFIAYLFGGGLHVLILGFFQDIFGKKRKKDGDCFKQQFLSS